MVEIPDKVLTPAEDEPEAPTPQGTEGEPTPETPSIVEAPKPIEVDYKKKFSESTRENQRLLEEDKLNKARLAETEAKLAEKANAIPSDDDLSKQYPEWEFLTDAEKSIFRRVEVQERDLAEIKEERAWQKDFSAAKVKFPQLVEREQEFKDYCYKYPRSIDAATLAKSFLFDEKPTEEPQRKGLESPTAGPKELGGSEFTWADVDRIRESDSKLFEKLIREGRIDTRKIKK